MFIILVGGGKLGTYLAKTLLEEKHEVIVIEKEERKAQRLCQAVNAEVALVGDGCDPLVLEEAGIARADVVIADTGDDEDNLVISLVTKKKFAGPRTIARINNPKNKQIFEELGIDSVVSATEVVMRIVQQEVNVREVAPLMTFKGGNLELVRLSVPAVSPAHEKRLSEIHLPRHCVIVALERNGEVMVPDGETTILTDDTMLIVAQPGATAELRAQLVGAG
ncbi:MAG: NAD-binding protein [Candidatus Eremiobacteraeota bacterium]|nr:NAD-binding protein [Candidatus Eremiobacteraeota bacterium]MBC5828228.1 NAD-binding protein [Candidatus Eremiobacteraeota bacterium]